MVAKEYTRSQVNEIFKTLNDRGALIAILVGPRQVGKTTAAHHIEQKWPGPVVFASADAILSRGPEWIEAQWGRARHESKNQKKQTLLILDEVQKVACWSEAVKALWDEDRRKGLNVRLLL